MSNNRILIPESIVVYLLGFLAACALLTGSLIVYYHLPELSERFGAESMSAFDLESSQNFLLWFFSVLWIIIAIDSIMIFYQAREMRLGLKAYLFWGNMGIIALAMSIDSFCSFHPILRALFDSCLNEAGATSAMMKGINVIIRLLVVSFIFIEVSFLLGYLRAQRTNRWILSAGLTMCMLIFSLSCFCSWQIPRPGQIMPEALPAETEVTSGLMADNETTNSITNEARSNIEIPTDSRTTVVNESESPFRNVSVETPTESSESTDEVRPRATSPTGYFANNETHRSHAGELYDPELATDPTPVPTSGEVTSETTEEATALSGNAKLERWEDLFGWDESLEEILGLSSDMESYIGWNEPVEEKVIGSGIALDLDRLRVVVRYGMYGLALIFFCTLVRLIVRAGRLRRDRQVRSRVNDIILFSESLRHPNCPRF